VPRRAALSNCVGAFAEQIGTEPPLTEQFGVIRCTYLATALRKNADSHDRATLDITGGHVPSRQECPCQSGRMAPRGRALGTAKAAPDAGFRLDCGDLSRISRVH
jgi:hypothetical protein